MSKIGRIYISIILLSVLNQSCGVKGKPLAPLHEPYISTGNYQEDLLKKNKDKKKNPQEKEELKPNAQ